MQLLRVLKYLDSTYREGIIVDTMVSFQKMKTSV